MPRMQTRSGKGIIGEISCKFVKSQGDTGASGEVTDPPAFTPGGPKSTTAPAVKKTTTPGPPPPLVFNLTDLQGDSVDKNVTVPSLDELLNFNRSTKTQIVTNKDTATSGGPPPPLVFNLTDLQGDSVDKNVTVPSLDELLNFNRSTKTQIVRNNDTTTSGDPPPPLVFNLTDLQGDSVDNKVTAPPMEKTSTHQANLVFNLTNLQGDSVDKNVTAPTVDNQSTPPPPLIWNLKDLQSDSVDKNVTAPPVDRTTSPLVFNLTGLQGDSTLTHWNLLNPTTNIIESSDGLEMPGHEIEEVSLGGDLHKSFMETEVDTLGGDEESEFYTDDLKNYGVNVDMFKSEESNDFLLPQRVKSASEESFDKQMGKKELRHILL